jgi:hypothetical protein
MESKWMIFGKSNQDDFLPPLLESILPDAKNFLLLT